MIRGPEQALNLDNSTLQNRYETRFTFNERGQQLTRTLPLGFGPDGQQGTSDDPVDASDFTESFAYDDVDRLESEQIDEGNDGTNERTIDYLYWSTQQTFKDTQNGDGSHTTLQFSYDLQGRLAQVMTNSLNSAGTLTRQELVVYAYDAMGIRVSAHHSIDANPDPLVPNGFESSTTTEYLVDHHNFTGYQQVIRETEQDADGNVVKVIDYTFGHDEISQRVTEYDTAGNPISIAPHVFGHDGHGSVRVLY